MAFSRIVFEFGWDDFELQAHLPTLLRTLLALIDEDSREVIKSVIGFIRICVAAIQAEQLKPLAPDIVTSLLKYQKAKSRFRSKVKIILKKLLKLFGYDFIYTLVPESESKLLVHMKKEEQRQKRKKEQGKQEKPRSSDFDEMLESDEEGSGDDGSFLSGATRFSRLTGREDERKGASGSAVESRTAKQLSLSSRKSRASSAASILLPNEKDGVIVDMLSSSIARRVKFAEDEIEDEESDGGLMEFDEDGRLVVLDDDDGHSDDAKLVEADDMNKTAKRRRTDNATQVSSRQSNGNRRAKSTRQGNQLGAAYRSKRAGGDVKRKDQKLEPYAYVPLDGRSYAKKHRRAAVEQMASIVNKGGKRKRGSR
jgi:ribosomal RNA-processing protein 12